jgi:6-phosphogluconolactonase
VAGTNQPETSPWRLFPDGDALAAAAAEQVVRTLSEAVAERGRFHLVLPGGSSPRGLLVELRDRRLPWQALDLYLTDERCLPQGHAQRNDLMFDELLLPYVPLPAANLHRIPAELGPEPGAREFAELLRHTPTFDLVILGVGEDGHTASLFPGSVALDDESPAVAVCDAPKPPGSRVSMGLQRLLDSRERMVIAMGAGKRAVLERIQEGEEFPVTRARPDAWYLDGAAAP